MAEHKFKMSDVTSTAMSNFVGQLRDEAIDHREAFDAKPESWQESDAGANADAWIERLEDLADEIENLEEEPSP